MTKDVQKKAVQEYGSPLYLYDMGQFRSNIDRLRENLFPESGLFFSMKANPLSEFCSIAYKKNCGIEIASGGELELALDSGVASGNIVFTGPGKTEGELLKAIDVKIYMIHTESLREIRIINQLAEKKNRNVPIALRINPNGITSTGKVQMSGTTSQFGIEETELVDSLYEEINSLKNINLSGVHIYMGTSVLNAEEICQNTEYSIRLGIELSSKYAFKLRYLNVGGRFGIPYFHGEKALDLI